MKADAGRLRRRHACAPWRNRNVSPPGQAGEATSALCGPVQDRPPANTPDGLLPPSGGSRVLRRAGRKQEVAAYTQQAGSGPVDDGVNGMSVVGPWICDGCGDEISSAADGYVLWATTDNGASGFRIIHQGGCDDRSLPNSMPLDSYIGLQGVTHLMTFLSVGPVKLQGDLTGNSVSVASTDEFADFVRRVQVPGYEQVRARYVDHDVQERLADANEWYPYTLETINRMKAGDL